MPRARCISPRLSQARRLYLPAEPSSCSCRCPWTLTAGRRAFPLRRSGARACLPPTRRRWRARAATHPSRSADRGSTTPGCGNLPHNSLLDSPEWGGGDGASDRHRSPRSPAKAACSQTVQRVGAPAASDGCRVALLGFGPISFRAFPRWTAVVVRSSHMGRLRLVRTRLDLLTYRSEMARHKSDRGPSLHLDPGGSHVRRLHPS